MQTMDYKGYTGTAEVDLDNRVCRGKLLFINDLVTYRSGTVAGLRAEFEAAVDDYLETCASLGLEPKRPFNGVFNVRIDPALHQAVALRSIREDSSINRIVARAIEAYMTPVQAVSNHHHVNITLNVPEERMEKYLASSAEGQWGRAIYAS